MYTVRLGYWKTNLSAWLTNWKYRWPAVYLGIAVVFGSSYAFVHTIIIDQACSFWAIISNVSLNLILLFFLWGVMVDRISWVQSKPRWVGWALFFAGLLAIITFMSEVSGLETRFM